MIGLAAHVSRVRALRLGEIHRLCRALPTGHLYGRVWLGEMPWAPRLGVLDDAKRFALLVGFLEEITPASTPAPAR